MNQETIYVTGHKHPDTDSVAAAVGYAFYKRCSGVKAVPCRLGQLNAESKYLLNRFGFEEPMFLEDARVKLGEIELDQPVVMHPDDTIFEMIGEMRRTSQKTCCVVDSDNRVLGVVTFNDAAVVAMGDTADNRTHLAEVSTENIATAISGQIIYRSPDLHLNGQVSVIAITKGPIDIFNVSDKIVIVGDDPECQLEVIEKGAGVLIVVRADEIREDVLAAAKAHNCSVMISGHKTMNTARYVFFAPPVSQIMHEKPICYYDSELVEEVGKKITRSRFRSYPVIDEQHHLKGLVSRYHVMTARNKKIIMVDHNEFSQSVRAIEKAEVLEVIDHHRISDFSTNRPVAFRNEIVGSSATIVATIFRENQVPIPSNLAGLLLGAILSDTLKFQSPTTTERDRQTANILAALADLDIDEFARDMFTVSSDVHGKTGQELINTDIKFFNIEGCRTMISQVIVPDAGTAALMAEQMQEELDIFTSKKDLDLCVLAMTSILDHGSVFIASGEKKDWAKEAFPDTEGRGYSFQKGILSRKSQIVPALTAVIQKYS